MGSVPAFSDEQMQKLAGLAFDFLCEQRVSSFLSVEQVLEAIDKGGEPERVARFQERFLKPQRGRLIELARKSPVKVGAWLPGDVRDELLAMLGEPAPLPKKLVEEAVASERVRDEVKAMLQDTLTSFINKAVGGVSDATPAAVGGAIGRLTKNFAAASKGILGGLGDTLQKQLQEKVRDFVDGSVTAVQKRIAEKLTSPETAAMVGKQRRKMILGALEEGERDVAAWIAKQPNDRIDAMVPKLVQHNLARAELRDAIRGEVGVVLEELSKQTLGELLDELGLRAWARAGTIQAGGPLLRNFCGSEAFAAWWSEATP